MEPEYDLVAFVCSHVYDDTRAILLVSKGDGDWQFLCGDIHDPDDEEGYRVVCIGHILERDTTVSEILDLPNDWEAEREFVGGPWERRRCAPEE